MAKKKKRGSQKGRSKARDRKQKKRTLRLAKSHPRPQVMTRPGLPHLGAPEGFRSISMAQAMLEYAKPMMKFGENDETGFNDAFQIATMLWNYALLVEKGDEDMKVRQEILKAIRGTFGLERVEAQSLLTKMIERRSFLFPPDQQPERGMPFMFIRKEVRYLIQPFDYKKLVIAGEIVLPDQDDRDLIKKINTLDELIYDGAEYDKYEKLLLTLEDECENLFERWLVAKGMLKDDAEQYSFCLQTYLNFIYAYIHGDIVILKSVSDVYFVEFFEDFLLRKMMVEPNEYVYWPPALKLFYRFLHEKGYLDNYEEIIRNIDRVEPYFIEVLRKQFS
ncbi:MAG: hypothetical protein DRN37_01550 [Thermoplasmata archaeon]|nr:MAG: hypothetical protein DRG82_15045 [Deltaproteobacteria bacterium]RLF61125.1 MAG: hypothetical protein DRN37_01550 [Thermoplasmata archaeon]